MEVHETTADAIKRSSGTWFEDFAGAGFAAGNAIYHTGVFYEKSGEWWTIFHIYGKYYSCPLDDAMHIGLPMINGSYNSNATPNPQWAVGRAKSLNDAKQYLTDFGQEMEREPGLLEKGGEAIGRGLAKITGETAKGIGEGVWNAIKEAPVVAITGVAVLGVTIYLVIRSRR